MAKHHKPRAGSLAYKPRKKAKKETPRLRSWVKSDEALPLGFAGYKAGMTNVLAVDNRKNSPTSGMEIFMPVTVLEVPPLMVSAIRAYRKGYSGDEAVTEVWTKDLVQGIENRLTVPKTRNPEKKLKELEKVVADLSEVRLIVATQPALTSMPKKTPDVMEIALGGDVEAQFTYAKEVLGSELKAEDVLTGNTVVDVASVTKGKGYQGVIKRYGIRIQPRKAGKGRRHIGSGGAWTPARKMWREPLPGQLGYHTRTEFNKAVLQVGSDAAAVNPAGGFLHYGPLNTSYVLLKGSVPGPAKRLVRLSQPKRPFSEPNFEITHINVSSKQGA